MTAGAATAAVRQVVRSILLNGIVVEMPASPGASEYEWRATEDGTSKAPRVTDLGLAAIGICLSSSGIVITSTKVNVTAIVYAMTGRVTIGGVNFRMNQGHIKLDVCWPTGTV